MTYTTPEEQEARLREIRRQLVDLSPIRQELLSELKSCELKIETLCKEKDYIERTKIKITICKNGASGRITPTGATKPVDMNRVVANLDPAQTQELLLQLMRMQRAAQQEEENED